MKKKLLTTFLSLAMCASGAIGIAALDNGVEANADDSKIIAAVTGDASTGFVTEQEWATVASYGFTGEADANVSVKFATVGENLFFRLTAEDTTKFSGKDRLAFKIAVGGVQLFDLQGNFDPWLTGEQPAAGTQVQCDFNNASNADNAVPYVLTYGVAIGNVAIGTEVAATFAYNDATTSETGWGAGAGSTFVDTLYLGGKPAAPETPAENSYVISAVTGDAATGLVSETEWTEAESYAFTGDTAANVKFATVGTNLFFRMTVNDTTKFQSTDRIAFKITVGCTVLVDLQGHYEGTWLQPGTVPADEDKAQVEWNVASNDDNTVPYVFTYGFNLRDNFENGAEVKVELTHNDAKDASAAWGQGAANTFAGTLYLGNKPGEGGEETPDPFTYVVPMIVGVPQESDWESCESYPMTNLTGGTTGATGSVKVIVGGGKLYFRMEVEDATILDNDRPDFTITVGDQQSSARGKYWDSTTNVTWLEPRQPNLAAGYSKMENVAPTLDRDVANGKYVLTVSQDIEADCAVSGAHIQVKFSHSDAQTASDVWGDAESGYPHAIGFEHTLYLGEYSETDTAVQPTAPDVPTEPEPTPGPENVNLNVVVTDLATMPKESDWNKATAYPLIANNGNLEGASGSIKILSAAGNLYFRFEVEDPTTCIDADGIYIYIGTDEYHLETRGNYDNWLAQKECTFAAKTPALGVVSTTADGAGKGVYAGTGKYTYDFGWYIPELYGEGNTLRLNVRHRDSRNVTEPWLDSDQKHTVYFDQIITFGEEADTTVRPQQPETGFVGGTESISYNKANITWAEYTGAETYKLYVYAVNAEGSAEPYTHLSVEGPIFSGSTSHSETIWGLTQTTKYVVQIVAYDGNDEAIAYSELVNLTTISRQEALNPDPDPDTNPDTTPDTTPDSSSTTDTSASTSAPTSSTEEGGCSSSVALTGISVGLTMLGAAYVATKKRRK